jgi:hypothetical protein
MKVYRKLGNSTFLFGMRATTLVVMVLAGLALSRPALATVKVLVYSNNGTPGEVDRLNGIPGISATGTSNLNDINPTNLANFDVFYAGSEFEHLLDPKASVLQSFLSSGRGVVVGQANVTGPIDWLPSGLGAIVADIWYPDESSFVLTPSGSVHPIFKGLNTPDFGGRPADTIYIYDLNPAWDVLMVHSTDLDIVGMAAGTYGHGRILLWPDRYDSDMGQNPSDQFLKQAYEWVAIPEPGTVLLVGLGGLAMVRKRRA